MVDRGEANILAMSRGDFFTVFLVATIVAMSLGSELRDIKLCQMSARDRGVGAWEGCCCCCFPYPDEAGSGKENPESPF